MREDKTKLSKVIHLYLGCQCKTDEGKIGTFAGFDICEKDRSIVMHTIRYFDKEDYSILNDDDLCERIKLILRPLSSMTEEECYEASVICGKRKVYLPHYWAGNGSARYMYMTPIQCFELTKYLLSKGFDLFGLIEKGLAIESDRQ